MKTKGILFDKDGTILDFGQTWYKALEAFEDKIEQKTPKNGRRILQALGFENGKVAANSLLASGTYFQIAEKLVTFPVFEKENPDQLAREIDQFFYDYLGEHLEEAQLMGDVAGLFARLVQEGFVIGIATADNLKSTQQVLEYLQLDTFVDFIASGDLYPAKPNPALLTAFCQKFDLNPDQVLIVGDSEVDISLGQYARCGILVGAEKNDKTLHQFQSIHDIPYESYFKNKAYDREHYFWT